MTVAMFALAMPLIKQKIINTVFHTSSKCYESNLLQIMSFYKKEYKISLMSQLTTYSKSHKKLFMFFLVSNLQFVERKDG